MICRLMRPQTVSLRSKAAAVARRTVAQAVTTRLHPRAQSPAMAKSHPRPLPHRSSCLVMTSRRPTLEQFLATEVATRPGLHSPQVTIFYICGVRPLPVPLTLTDSFRRTVKSNTVLTPQYPDSQLATERAFMSKSNSTIKEGLSSDEDDFVHKQAAPEFDSKCVPTRAAKDLFEDIYGSRLAAYGNFGAGQLVPTSKEKGAELFGKRSSNLDATLYTSGSGNNRSGCSHQQPPVSGSQLDKSSALFLGTSE